MLSCALMLAVGRWLGRSHTLSSPSASLLVCRHINNVSRVATATPGVLAGFQLAVLCVTHPAARASLFGRNARHCTAARWPLRMNCGSGGAGGGIAELVWSGLWVWGREEEGAFIFVCVTLRARKLICHER